MEWNLDASTARSRGAVAAVVLGAVVAAVAAVRSLRTDAETDRARLLDAAAARTERTFDPDDVADLPAPVRRYFETVLDEGQPHSRTVRLEQRGQFRVGDANSAWKPLEATQRVTVDPPGFVWDATVRLAPFVPVRVVDAYVEGEGSLRARLLSVLTVADADPSPELDAGELQRYLAEAVWYPTALLPGAGVRWDSIDERSARATLEHEDTTVSLVFQFDDENLVERVVADDRPRAVDDGFEPTRWTGRFWDYRERNGVLVPTVAEVEWNLPEGDLPYWRATISDFEHRPAASERR